MKNILLIALFIAWMAVGPAAALAQARLGGPPPPAAATARQGGEGFVRRRRNRPATKMAPTGIVPEPAAPTESEPYRQGVTAVDQAKWDDAITALTEAIRLDPKSAAAYSTRGLAYTMKDNFEAALADLDAALKLESEQRHRAFQPRLRLLPQGRQRQGRRRLHGNDPHRSEVCQRLPRPRLYQDPQGQVQRSRRGLEQGDPARPQEREGLYQPRHDLLAVGAIGRTPSPTSTRP